MPGFPAGGGPEGDGALIPGPGPAHPIGTPSPERPWGGMGPLIIVSLDCQISRYPMNYAMFSQRLGKKSLNDWKLALCQGGAFF